MDHLPKHELVNQFLAAIDYSVPEYLADTGIDVKRVEPEFATLAEAAEYCRVSRQTLYNWRKRGVLEFYEMADHTKVVRIADLRALVKPCMTSA